MKKLFTPLLFSLGLFSAQAAETDPNPQLDSILYVDPSIADADSVGETNIFIWNDQDKLINNYYLYGRDTSYKAVYSYENERLSTLEDEYEDEGEWIKDSKLRYVYDDSGSLEFVYYGSYDDVDGWEETGYTEYTHTAEGYIASETNYTLEDGVWTGREKFEYTYDANGIKLSETESRMRTEGWVEVEKTVTSIANGLVTETNRYALNNGVETLNRNDTFEYDTNGNIIRETASFDENDDGTLSLSIEILWTYDSERASTGINYVELGISNPEFAYSNRVISLHYIEYRYGEIDYESKGYFFYSDDAPKNPEQPEDPETPEEPENPSTALTEASVSSINYASGVISYSAESFTSVSIIGMDGRVYIRQKGSGDMEVSIADLPAGVYTVQVQEAGTVSNTSIVVL